ncbi:MAG TPA: hypothetical protein VFI47_08700 [Acidimicrobiales bacterium]|nr:hypothetical protein [Acidimicrobiales bacterium]
MTMIAAMAMSFSPFHRRGRPREGEEPQPRIPPAPADSSSDPLGELVVGEVEAFLTGRLVEHLLATGRPVPAWAALNRLAHGALEDVIELAQPGDEVMAGRDRREAGWQRGQRALAAHLVASTATPGDVVDVQWEVLVPLELWLIERSRSETITSRRILEIAVETLVAYQRDE